MGTETQDLNPLCNKRANRSHGTHAEAHSRDGSNTTWVGGLDRFNLLSIGAAQDDLLKLELHTMFTNAIEDEAVHERCDASCTECAFCMQGIRCMAHKIRTKTVAPQVSWRVNTHWFTAGCVCGVRFRMPHGQGRLDKRPKGGMLAGFLLR